MNIGVLVETEEGLDWDHWRETYTAAERLGFESVWISDHLASPWSATRHGLDTWTALAVAAAETRRVVLGPLVSPVTFREPAIMARMAANLDTLSGGRFVVGLGLGWNAEEHAAAGIVFPAVAERAQRLIETTAHIRSESSVPILVGGKGRSILPIVACCADQWNVTTASPFEFRCAADELDAACREVGRDPGAILRSVAMGLLIGRDADELRERGERMRRCVQPLAEATNVLETARSMGWLVGTPAEVNDALRQLDDTGAQRTILGHYDLTDLAALELLAETAL
jgi:alkanesulfonate monooxygenase SsuD/methylene tetrahydromethanopterin reductase-like flavin-dependent oxidoreductase (luciferase family)